MNMEQALLERASDLAFAKLQEACGDSNALTLPLQTVVVIYTAQGIIDNGGLEYFYESNFDGNPRYSTFVDAYRRIGAENAANCIEKTMAMFGFPEPHLNQLKRWEFLERVKNDEAHELCHLSRAICGDEDVWERLSEYVAENRTTFEAA
jgi:hypothetical protein